MFKRLLILSIAVTSSCSSNAKQVKIDDIQTAIDYNKQLEIDNLTIDAAKASIQSKVNQAFVQSMLAHNDQALVALEENLKNLYKSKNQNILLYWQAYLLYHTSIFHLQEKNKKVSASEICKAIELIKPMKNKNSEDYTILAMLQSFSIQFQMINATSIAAEVSKNLKNALELDPNNIRAHYVFASNDFYTPKKYGGGKKVEAYLLKAITLPPQKISNDYLPSWGKEESYEMLVNYYIQNEKWKPAKQYYQEGMKAFPQSHLINQYGPQLVDK